MYIYNIIYIPYVMGVPTIIIPFLFGILHEINHPAIGYPHLWKPPYGIFLNPTVLGKL
jgi:hypothetical protein